MNLLKYQRAALRTAQPTREHTLRLAVAGLGLSEEAAEVLDVVRQGAEHDKVVLEIGDLVWYGAELASALGISLGAIDTHPRDCDDDPWSLADDLVISTGILTGTVKKTIGHGHPVDEAKITALLQAVFVDVATLSASMGSDLATVCEANIAKLRRRYPDGFSTERSQNRPD